MTTQLISLFAETFIHPGCGQNEGAIDLPVARERVTQYPFIAGSSLKGAWRDYAEQNWKTKEEKDLETKIREKEYKLSKEKEVEYKELHQDEIDELIDSEIGKKLRDTNKKINTLFGKSDHAGELLISDARLLLLPIRSLQYSYCQVTCPALLNRLNRDIQRSNSTPLGEENEIVVSKGEYLGKRQFPLFLEERNFQHENDINTEIIEKLQAFIPDDYSKNLLKSNLVILCDKDFKWFAEHALSIQARNVLDENKQSKNLWYEETLPPDTVMYSLVSTRNNTEIPQLFTSKSTYLQVGGNETVGQGWFHISIPNLNTVEEGDSNG